MTADNSNDTTAQAENQGKTGKSRGRKPGRKRSAASSRGRSKTRPLLDEAQWLAVGAVGNRTQPVRHLKQPRPQRVWAEPF